MKYIPIILLLFISISVQAQNKIVINPATGTRNTISHNADSWFPDSVLMLPSDSTYPRINMTNYLKAKRLAAMQVDTLHNIVYIFNPHDTSWFQLNSSVLQYHTAGLGLLGSPFNGSVPQTWILDTAFIREFIINPILGVDTSIILVDSIICASSAALEGVPNLVCDSPLSSDTFFLHKKQIVTRTGGVLNYQTPTNGDQLVTASPVVYYQYSGTYPTGIWVLQHRVVQATFTNYGGSLNIGTSNNKNVNIGVKNRTIASFGTDSLLLMKRFIGSDSTINFARWYPDGRLGIGRFTPQIIYQDTNYTRNDSLFGFKNGGEFWTGTNSGGGSSERFGIEDNLGLQDRSVDMQGFNFVINNARLWTLSSDAGAKTSYILGQTHNTLPTIELTVADSAGDQTTNQTFISPDSSNYHLYSVISGKDFTVTTPTPINGHYYSPLTVNNTPADSTGNITIGAGSGITALTGDVTASGTGSVAATLATVNSNVGSFGDATHVGAFTVNGKGLITAASSVAITGFSPTFTVVAPLTYAANVIGITQATTSTNGYLSSTDWNTFNNKQATISVTSPITLTGASVGMINQGTTTTVLHGNASGNPSFGSIVNADITNATIVASTKLSATGTPSSSTALFGDNTWKTVSGSGTVKAVYAPLHLTSGQDSIYAWFNVLAYGADNTGISDSRAAFNAAIAAAVAAHGGVVYIPIGAYIISASGSQFDIEIPPNTDSTRCHVVIIGEAPPNFIPVGGGFVDGGLTVAKTGVRLISTRTSGVSGAAMFGIGFSFNSVTFQNLAIQVKNNPSGTGPIEGGINWKLGQDLWVDKCVIYVDTILLKSTLPSNDVSGIETPDDQNGESYVISNCLVAGFHNGYKIGEHVKMYNDVAWSNYYGINCKTGGHASSIYEAELSWNFLDIYGSGTLSLLPSSFTHEGGAAGKWYSGGGGIKDTANLLDGMFTYKSLISGGTLTKTGGANINLYKHDSTNFPILNRAANIFNSGGAATSLGLSSTLGSAYNLYRSGRLQWSMALDNLGAGDSSFSINSHKRNTDVFFADGTGYVGMGGSDARVAANAGIYVSSANKTIIPGSLYIGQTSSSYALDVSGSGNSIFHVKSSNGNTVFAFDATASHNCNLVYQNAGTNLWYMQNDNISGTNAYTILNSDANGNSARFKLTQAGFVTLNAYGVGTITSDASGNWTSVSDIRLKKNIRPYYSGLKSIMNINPITFQYNSVQPHDTIGTYTGFSAQNIKSNIPNSTGTDASGYLSLDDRSIIATLVNGMKEQQAEIESLKKEVKKLKKGK